MTLCFYECYELTIPSPFLTPYIIHIHLHTCILYIVCIYTCITAGFVSIQSWWAEFGGGACLLVGLVVVVSGCDCGCCCLDDLLRLLTTLYTQREHPYVCACVCVCVLTGFW